MVPGASWIPTVLPSDLDIFCTPSNPSSSGVVSMSGGAIVLGFGVMKFLSPYTISKAGIIQATRAMALELAGNRIRVNALAPGYIDTEMNHDFWATPAGEKLTKRIPQRRIGAESDLDGAILLLASSASRYMTGSVVTVDVGFLLN